MKLVDTSGYRLQLNHQFGFSHACQIIPYLAQLGVSAIYSSPITCAQPGSLHGYDVIDPTRLNPEIGDFKSLSRLTTLRHKYNLGLWLDIVPNHMASSHYNEWWQDVLRRGKLSPYAFYFDIDWKNIKKLSYRRFFDINELVCLKMENRRVFNATHQFIFDLIEKKWLTGLRIDHVDGLKDPKLYLSWMDAKIFSLTKDPFLLIVEKILAYQELLPNEWNVDGTTGYDFLNVVNALFIDPKGYQNILTHYQKLTGQKQSWSEIAFLNKKKVIEMLFSEEASNLTDSLGNIVDSEPSQLHEALINITAALRVYRTYITYPEIRRNDQLHLTQAFKYAKKKLGSEFHYVIDLIAEVFLRNRNRRARNWVMRWQQFTSPVMAKGLEDTTSYVFNPLISLNEVGSDPRMTHSFANLNFFHRYLKKRRKHHSSSINTSSTHDTKRSEDVRARINVLSELASEWKYHFDLWRKSTRPLKIKCANRQTVPNANTEFLLYQSLLGAWPISKERVRDFMIKASRESKIDSSWEAPNLEYETALSTFIFKLLDPKDPSGFLELFIPFQNKIAFFGAFNSLSQLLIKLTAPGIPDIYQGNEIWNFKLVDPDNRQPVDYQYREALLKKIIQEQSNPDFLQDLCRNWTDGRIKLFTIFKTLQFCNQFDFLFNEGKYIGLNVRGKHRLCAISFARTYGRNWVLTVVPRWVTRLVSCQTFPLGNKVWDNTRIIIPKKAPKKWKNVFSDEIINIEETTHGNYLLLGKIFSQFPIGLLYGYY